MERSLDYMLLAVLLLLAIIPAPLAQVARAGSGGVEFNLVDVWVPSRLYGQLAVWMAPLNVSEPGLATTLNTYVIDEKGQPYYSYLFSTVPPLAVWVDPSISARTYSIMYGGTNPYSNYIATPGGSVPLFAGWDDFDYDSGFWIYTGRSHSIQGSQLILKDSSAMLNRTYTPGVVSLWLIRYGAYGTMIQLYSSQGYIGWVHIRLTDANFQDWGSIRDGTDIYFTDANSQPLHYALPIVDLKHHLIDVLVYVDLNPGTNTIYMHYGGDNPYSNYKVPLITQTAYTEATPYPLTTTTQTAYTITGATPRNITWTTINQTLTLNPGDKILPHLYKAYFNGEQYVYETIFNTTNGFSAEACVKPVEFYKNGETFWNGRLMGVNDGYFGNGGWHIQLKTYNYIVLYRNATIYESKTYITPFNVKNNYRCYGVVYNISRWNLYINKSLILTGTPSIKMITSSLTFGLMHSPAGDTYIKGYLSYGYIKPSLGLINGTILTNDIFIFDPTWFNGTHYIDPVQEKMWIEVGERITRLPDDSTWLWVVENSTSDGLVWFDWIPYGSLIKIYDSNNSLVGTVFAVGPVDAGGFVHDIGVPLPPGNYTVIMNTWTYRGGYENQGLYLVRALDNALGLSTGSRVLTSDAGSLWVEYADSNNVVAWYGPGYSGNLPVYTTSKTGGTPFMYWNDFSNANYLSPLAFPFQPFAGKTLEGNVSVGWLTTQALSGVKLRGNSTVLVHLYDWHGTGDALEASSNRSYTLNGIVSVIVNDTVYTPSNLSSLPAIIDASKLTAYLDPTLYNGTHYIDPATGNTAQTNATRLETTTPRITILENTDTDNKIHFRYLPPGTKITITDTATGVAWTYYILGTPLDTGLTPDYTITPPTTNPVNITIQIPGKTTILPHLYVLKTNNEIYMKPSDYTPSYTIAYYKNIIINTSLRIINQNTSINYDVLTRQRYGYDGFWLGFFKTNENGEYFYFYFWNNQTLRNKRSSTGLDLSDFHEYFLAYNGTSVVYKIDGNLFYNYNYGSRLDVAIPRSYYYKLFYNVGLFDKDTYYLARYIIIKLDNNIVLFFDPTFYNGTHFIDPVTGATGTPNGAVRIPDNKTWLLVVDNGVGEGDGAGRVDLVLSWIPVWSYIRVYNSTGGLVWEGYASGPVNKAGYVTEMKIPLPPGDYKVQVQLPQPYIMLETTADIQQGTAILPHLYDWYFDGIDDYIYVKQFNFSKLIDGQTFDFVIHPLGQSDIIRHGVSNTGYGYFSIRLTSTGALVYQTRSSCNNTLFDPSINYVDIFDNYTHITITYNYTNLTFYKDDEAVATYSDTRPDKCYDFTGLYIGRHLFQTYYKGYIRYMAIFARDLNTTEITLIGQHHISTDTKPYLLLDPSFFNGTRYIDPISGVVGTPYGGVQRIPDTETWLWIVENSTGDGLVHFRYLPYGSIIRLYDTSGHLKYVFTVSGSVNGAGLVEDYAVSVASGTYKVEVLVPSWYDSGVADDLSSVSYSGSRDSYSLQASTSVDNSVNYDGKVAVGIAPYAYGLNTASMDYQAYRVWGTASGGARGVYDPGLGVVFDARINAPRDWILGLARLDDNRVFTGETPVALLGLDGEIYLYYEPDNAYIDTGLNYTTGKWLYVSLGFLPNGTIQVKASNGEYPGLYDAPETYTYKASNWTSMLVAPYTGAILRQPGSSETLYVDWLRARASMVGEAGLHPSSLAFTPFHEYQYTISLGGGTSNWTLFINATGLQGLRITMPGVHHTWIIQYGSIGYVSGAMAKAVLPFQASNTITISYENHTVKQETASMPSATTIVLGYEQGAITLSYYDQDGVLHQLVTYNSEDTMLGVVTVTGLASQFTAIPLYTLNTTPAYNLVASVTPTIVPASGSKGVTLLGYEYYSENTTGNETIPYRLRFGVLINGTTVYNYINDNGTVKSLELGTAKTPMIVGVGYDVDNATNTLSVYSFIEWMEERNGHLYTYWKYGYLDYKLNTTIDHATPIITANNTTLMVDRFGLTLGWAMSQFIHGTIKIVPTGPYPVGGLVKYVTITGPIVVKLVGGSISVEPAPAGTTSTITLVGFRGWTLNLAVYGANVNGMTITGDSYPVDFPTGFSAVIIADISSRSISIVSAEAPGLVHHGSIPTGSHLAIPGVRAPRFNTIIDAPSAMNSMFLAIGLVALALASNRVTGNLADGVIIGAFIGALILLVIGDYMNMSIAVAIAFIALAYRARQQLS